MRSPSKHITRCAVDMIVVKIAKEVIDGLCNT